MLRTLFFLSAVRDAGARRVAALAPSLCYAHRDRRTKPRDPVSIRYLATLFEAVGIDWIGAVPPMLPEVPVPSSPRVPNRQVRSAF